MEYLIKEINLYGFFIVLSFIIGFIFISINLVSIKMPKSMITSLYLLNIVCSIYFAKLLTIITSNDKSINIVNAGLSSLGGMFGFLLSICIFVKIYQKNTKFLIEIYALTLPLIYGVSKLGCHFAGCCEGIPYSGIFHTISKLRNDNIELFPIQLLETMVFLLIFIISIILYYKKINLNYLGLELTICSISKFLLDYLRDFHIGKIITTNQIICIIICIIGLIIIRKNKN